METENFMFQLTREEIEEYSSKSQIATLKIDMNISVKSQFATSRNTTNLFSGQDGGTRKLPYAFTEQGVAMLSGVLKSETAIKMSIQIMNAFVAMRHFLQNNAQVFTEINSIKHALLDTNLHQKETDQKVQELFTLIDKYNVQDTQDIQKFNSQYPTITMNYTTRMHDRFLIIDQKILYHLGASLKDLGKKCFAFEILDATFIHHLLQKL
jgi:hypothetical protein